MPDHSTWFHFLPFYTSALEWAREQIGLSWYKSAPIEIAHIFGFLFVAFLILLLALSVRKYKNNLDSALIPEGKFNARNFLELFTEAILGMMEPLMGREAAIYFLPLIGTVGLLILFSNCIGLVPGFAPPTSTWNTTVAMALVIFFTTHIYGLKKHGVAYLKHFLGPIIKWYALPLMLIMLIIELIGHLARPLSLSVRLMGNMFADHLVVATFAMLVPILLPLPVMILGVLVCVVQTLVFCLLSMIYISLAIEEQEH